MGALQAEIAGADEALKALFDRFKEAPASSAFEELAEALLARGHANEALQIAEHGLQLCPDNANGRVHRASALLALGRPRVAYVELVRALAIDKGNRRGLRVLGKVFVEAGQPERAAALLAKRHEHTSSVAQVDRAALDPDATIVDTLPPEAEHPPLDRRPTEQLGASSEPSDRSTIPAAPPEAAEEEATPPKRSSEPPLGPKMSPPPPAVTEPKSRAPEIPQLFAELTKDLGLHAERAISTKVEVTQVVRSRKPRKRDQLSSIEGPIVDRTQPGDLGVDLEYSSEPPSTLFDLVTSPQFQGMGVSLDDDPLSMPFSVQGVSGEKPAAEETDDEVPKLDLDVLQSRMQLPQKHQGELSPSDLSDPGVLGPVADVKYLKRFEKSRASKSPDGGPALELTNAPASAGRLLLGVVATLLLVAYVAALVWFSKEELSAWFSTGTSTPEKVEIDRRM